MPSIFRRAAHKVIHRAAPRISLAQYRRLFRRSPIGFFYHAVSSEPLPHVRHLYPYKDAHAFEMDLHWLAANTALVGYEDLQAHVLHGVRLPNNAAYISFDDGFAECFSVARPLLLKHHIPAIFFLTTDWVDNRALFYRSKVSLIIDALKNMSVDDSARSIRRISDRFGLEKNLDAVLYWLKALPQSRENAIDDVCDIVGVDPQAFLADRRPYLTQTQIHTMQSEGFVFGAHARRHAKLAGLSPDEQAAEIVASCQIVAQLTGKSQVPFAFPFSGDNVSRPMLSDLQHRFPEIGLIFDTRKLRQEPGILHRIWVDKPVSEVPPEQNLAHWLHDAYLRDMAERALG